MNYLLTFSIFPAVSFLNMAKFLYFAYGSNLLAKRIHVNNPTAVRIGIAELLGYRLDFAHFSQRWKGCAATIAPQANSSVWGSVWELDNTDMEHLDDQEGVSNNVYRPIEVFVTSADGIKLKCRSYELVSLPEYSQKLPKERYPSKIYLDTIISGAKESNLPHDYIDKLNLIPTNGFDGPINIYENINK